MNLPSGFVQKKLSQVLYEYHQNETMYRIFALMLVTDALIILTIVLGFTL